MIRTFMEVFVGSYKDGTDGGRDYRLTAALYLFVRIMVGVAWSISKIIANSLPTEYYGWLMGSVPFVLLAVGFAYFKPHRKWSHNLVDILLFLLITKMCLFLQIVFETTINEHGLRILVLVLLIDIVIPQVALLVYCAYRLKLVCLQDMKKLKNIVRGK